MISNASFSVQTEESFQKLQNACKLQVEGVDLTPVLTQMSTTFPLLTITTLANFLLLLYYTFTNHHEHLSSLTITNITTTIIITILIITTVNKSAVSPAQLQSGPNQSNCQNHTPTQSSFEHLQHIGLQVCNIIWQFFPISHNKFLQRLAKPTQSSAVLPEIICCMSGIQSNCPDIVLRNAYPRVAYQ